MSHRYRDQGLTGIAPGSDMYYVGMIVSLKPLVGQRREDLLEWCEPGMVRAIGKTTDRFTYRVERLRGAGLSEIEVARGAVRAVLRHARRRATSPGWGPDFDASIITNDRPFPSCPTTFVPELLRLLMVASGICLVLGGLFAVGALRGTERRGGMGLLLFYNVAIGFAYFFIEIMLIQAYQGVFLSPSASLVLVLGVLLIGSAIGGLLADRVRLWWATVDLGARPGCAACTCLPGPCSSMPASPAVRPWP